MSDPMILVFVALQAADLVTTVWFLRLGGVEKFALSAAIIQRFGIEGFAVLKIAIAAALVSAYIGGKLPEAGVWAVVVIYAVITLNNVLLIKRLWKLD